PFPLDDTFLRGGRCLGGGNCHGDLAALWTFRVNCGEAAELVRTLARDHRNSSFGGRTRVPGAHRDRTGSPSNPELDGARTARRRADAELAAEAAAGRQPDCAVVADASERPARLRESFRGHRFGKYHWLDSASGRPIRLPDHPGASHVRHDIRSPASRSGIWRPRAGTCGAVARSTR